MIREDAFTLLRLEPPNFLGITAPFCLVAPTLKSTLLALIISFFNVSPFLSWTSLFPPLINFGIYLRKIFLFLIPASLNNTPLLLRTCPRSYSTLLSKPPCYISGAKDTGLLLMSAPFSIKSRKPNFVSLRLSTPP